MSCRLRRPELTQTTRIRLPRNALRWPRLLAGTSIRQDCVYYTGKEPGQETRLDNDLVFILAGGELPTQFLEKSGIMITRKFGEAILKHEK